MPLWEPMKIKGVCYPSVHLVKTFLASLMLSPSLISQPKGVQSMVSANVSLTGNHSKGCMAHSMSKFSLLKTFAMDIHPPKPFIVKRVDWFPHLLRVSIG
ncbi:hypothetical protein GmHk_09G024875 [Glycine max]|nr:hypothetical protein GmHk_09G024875 [Glycine max]